MNRLPPVLRLAARYAAPALLCAAVTPLAAEAERAMVERAPAAEAAADPVLPPTQPAAPRGNPPDESFLISQRRQRDNGRNEYAAMNDGGEVAVTDLLRFSLADGTLRVEPTPRVGEDAERFRVAGADAICTVALVPLPNTPRNRSNGGVSITFTRFDAGVTNDTDVWTTELTVTPDGNYLSFTGQSVLGRVMLSQNLTPSRPAGVVRGAAQQPVTLTVLQWQAGLRQAVVFRGFGGTLAELRAKHPDEFRRYAMPVMAKASDLRWLVPGPAEAYRVFDEIPADPAAAARLRALLPDLDSDAYPVRQAAARRLMELGPAGALAALRTDPDALSDEQKGQLGRLIAAHRRWDVSDPLVARSDPAFLTDCLEHEDAAVRRAAKASLEKVLGRPIAFDPDAPPDQQAVAVDAVRTSVLNPASDPAAATQPGTRPAAGAPDPAEVPPDRRPPAVER